MIIQALNAPTLKESQQKQELVLQREDLAPCSLGTVGNLQFKPYQGGTARASHFKTQLTRVLHALSDMVFLLTHICPQARAQRADLMQARKNSRLIGNLLGYLTAPAYDPAGQARIAEALVELATLCDGNIDRLKGGQQALDWYVKELSKEDFTALANGALPRKELVLKQISMTESDPLIHMKASQVLDWIEQSMYVQLYDAWIENLAFEVFTLQVKSHFKSIV